MDVVWEGQVREKVTGERESTDDVVGGSVELFLQVDDGERHAEKVDGVASPGQPAAERPGFEIKVQPLGTAKHSPREEETPLRPSETGQNLQQRPRSLYLLFLRDEVSQKVRSHRGG